MEKINIAELLKDCTTGMELDSTVYDNCTLEIVFDGCLYPIQIRTPEGLMNLTKYGSMSPSTYAKCVIFPKGKTTWEGFQKPWTIQDAKDGDVIIYNDGWTCIFKCIHGIEFSSYCFITRDREFHTAYETHSVNCAINSKARLATKEQCNLFFQKIKEAGYKWNPKTKTLEKLDFKDGDILATNDGKFIAISKKNGGKYYACCHTNGTYFEIDRSGWFDRLATEEEKQKLFDAIKANGYRWNSETNTLEKLVEPKFKVNDLVIWKHNTKIPKIIKKIQQANDGNFNYWIEGKGCTPGWCREDELQKFPDKLNITTLKPFDKVLVRDDNECVWKADFYSHYKGNINFCYICTGDAYRQCIPYNEETANLVGTTNDCPNKYKIWKDE